jgi:hypothetical protein
VLKSFNTWAFKREQPSDPQRLLTQVAQAIARSEPVPFVLYWGKGPRCKVGAEDLECLNHLGTMAGRVKEVYAPGAALKLIFTDTHASLNGHPAHSMNHYFAEVDVAAGQRGFASCRLSQLIGAADLAASAGTEDVVSDDMLDRLCTSTMKWYRGKELRHLQRKQVPLPVPAGNADLLHVFVAARGQREAVVPAGRCAVLRGPGLRLHTGLSAGRLPQVVLNTSTFWHIDAVGGASTPS